MSVEVFPPGTLNSELDVFPPSTPSGGGGGTGTVTNIATTAPITGGPITTAGTIAITDFVASGASHARGSVPDPGAVAGTTKYLREDASWTVPPDTTGVTSVASADGSVTVTNPTTTVDLSVNTTTPNAIQAAFANRLASMSMWTSNGSVQTIGMLLAASGSLGGPLVTPVYTTPLSMARRADYTSTAAINQSAGYTASRCDVFRGNATWGGGFMVSITFGFEQLNADSRIFVGLNSTVGALGIAGTDPSANMPAAGAIGFAFDSADTQWQLMNAASNVAATKVALGASFGRPSVTGDLYRAWFYCNANASGISVRLDKYTTSGTTTYTNTVSAAIPTATTTLNIAAGCGTGPTVATAVKFAASQLTIEQFTP